MKNASLPQGFFLGQIPPNWNEYSQGATWQDAHNHRVKVRIPGKHSKGNELPDKDLPWAIVEQSTASGNLSNSSIGLWGGEWVTGYFLDKEEQIPVITGVLGINTIQDGEIRESINGSTQLKPVNPYNTGKVATKFQMVGGPRPTESPQIDKKTVSEATNQSPALPEEATDGLRFKSPEEWWEGVQAAGGRIKNFFDPSSEQSNEPTVRVGERTPTTGGITQPSIPSRDQDGNVYGQQ